jgi:hypothetical protein
LSYEISILSSSAVTCDMPVIGYIQSTKQVRAKTLKTRMGPIMGDELEWQPVTVRDAPWGGAAESEGRAATKAHAGRKGPARWRSRGDPPKRGRGAGVPPSSRKGDPGP